MKGKFIRITYIMPLFLLYISCTSNNSKPDTKKEEDNSSSYTKPPSSFSDTIVVPPISCAVFFKPDSLQLEKIKTVTTPAVFDSKTHDCYYQMRFSRLTIQKDWPKVKIIEAKDVRYILFKLVNGSSEVIDLDKQFDICGVILFNGSKKAEFTDMTNIETALVRYFGY
ncbi:MAG TPA: hypothetical protein VFN30_02075 [Chitinophagaceae bacterium]|nr:hypothetical protein [Chitinophagaceae bacterium]